MGHDGINVMHTYGEGYKTHMQKHEFDFNLPHEKAERKKEERQRLEREQAKIESLTW